MSTFTTFYRSAFFLLTAVSAFAATPTTAWREQIGANESAEFAKLATDIQDVQKKLAKGGEVQRGFHAKPHAALSAELTVLPGLPEHLRHGMFRDAKTYKCFVRFSNGVGVTQSDSKPDVRGLAVKVVGVPGKKLLEGEETATTQDFLMTNHPVSLARNATQFMGFARANVNPLTLPITLAREVGLKEAARITAFLARSLARPIKSSVTETYWTGGPVTFGPYAAKLLFRPIGAPGARGLFPGRDGLRKDLRTRIAGSDVRFGLYVQFFVDDERTPIEDTTVEWEEDVAPPVKLAELKISRRDLESAKSQKEEEFVNALAFTPWHATEDMRPIGHTMRARKAVYRASAQLRRHAPEPTGAEVFE